MAHDAEATEPEGAWEFHDGTGPHDGWLYRHADGTLVTEDGTVLEEVAADPVEPTPLEPVETSEGAETVEPAEPPAQSVEPVETTPEPAEPVETTPEPDERVDADAATVQPVETPAEPALDPFATPIEVEEVAHVEHAEDAGPDEPAAHDPFTAPLEVEETPHPEPAAPDGEADPAWRFPQSWSQDAAEETQEPTQEPTQDATSEDEPAEDQPTEDVVAEDGKTDEDDSTDAAVVSTGSTDDDERPDEDEQPDEDQPAAEDETSDESEETDQGEQPGEDPTSDESEETNEPADARAVDEGATGTAAPPTYLRWEARPALQYVAGLVFAVASVAAVLLVFRYLAEPDQGRLVTAAGLALLAVAGLVGLSTFSPSVVTLHDDVLTVERGERTTRFDLDDPQVQVDVSGSTGSPSWRARLVSPSGERELLRRTDVDPAEFAEAVSARRHGVA